MIYNIPEKLKDLDKENGKVEINEIDLDGDGKKEHIVVASDYDVDAKFSTKIMLYDSEYTKIADLVNFENPYYKNEEDLTNYTVTSLSLAGNVECMDIDNDGNMEILIDIPIWEGKGQLSIVKYQNGKIQGEKEVTGSVRP